MQEIAFSGQLLDDDSLAPNLDEKRVRLAVRRSLVSASVIYPNLQSIYHWRGPHRDLDEFVFDFDHEPFGQFRLSADGSSARSVREPLQNDALANGVAMFAEALVWEYTCFAVFYERLLKHLGVTAEPKIRATLELTGYDGAYVDISGLPLSKTSPGFLLDWRFAPTPPNAQFTLEFEAALGTTNTALADAIAGAVIGVGPHLIGKWHAPRQPPTPSTLEFDRAGVTEVVTSILERVGRVDSSQTTAQAAP